MAFRAVYCCKECGKRLTDDEVMYSDGVCPYCGYVSDGTICDYIKQSEEVLPCTSASGFWTGLWQLLRGKV